MYRCRIVGKEILLRERTSLFLDFLSRNVVSLGIKTIDNAFLHPMEQTYLLTGIYFLIKNLENDTFLVLVSLMWFGNQIGQLSIKLMR